jgi:hypothetical protein
MSADSVTKCFSPNSKAARRSGNYKKSMEAVNHFSDKGAVPKKITSKKFKNENVIKKYKVTTVSPSGTVSRYNIFAQDDEQMNRYFYNAEKNGDRYFSISFFHPLVNKKRDVYNISLQDGWRYSQTLKKVFDSDNKMMWKDVRELYNKNNNDEPKADEEEQAKDEATTDDDNTMLFPSRGPKDSVGARLRAKLRVDEQPTKEVPNFLELPEDEFPEL